MSDLSTKYLGLQLRNPLVPSASPMARDLDTAKRLIVRLSNVYSSVADHHDRVVPAFARAAAFGGLFTLIDSGHKGFELAPKELFVTLTKADGPPRVDTILINADDFQDIKWIRVRKD